MSIIHLLILSSDTKFHQKSAQVFHGLYKKILAFTTAMFDINTVYSFIKEADGKFLGLVFRFGKILPGSLVEQNLFLNIHYSLLPKYRGASPVIAQILNDEKEVGITVHRVRKELDSGEILFQVRKTRPFLMNQKEMTEWLDRITYDEVLNRLYNYIAEQKVFSEDAYTPQKGRPSYAPLSLSLKQGAFCNVFSLTAKEVFLRVQAFYPEPVAWIKIRIDGHLERIMNLYKVELVEDLLLKPGEVRFLQKDYRGMAIGTLLGSVLIKDASIEGKRRLKQHQWLALKGRIEVV